MAKNHQIDSNKTIGNQYYTRVFVVFGIILIITAVSIPRILGNYYSSQAEDYIRAGFKDEAVKSYIKAKSALFWTISDISELKKIDDAIKEQTINVQDIIPSITLYTTPTPSFTPTVKKAVIDTDPIIDCVSDAPNCKGDIIRARRSQCPEITCCGFTDGRWVLYPNLEKCKQDAEAAQNQQQPVQVSNNTNNKVMINVDDGGGLTKGSFYCYSDKVNQIADLQNQIRYAQSAADSCNFVAQSTGSNCVKEKCYGIASSDPEFTQKTSSCSKSCYDEAYSSCNNNKVGDLRSQLSSYVHRYCP